MQTYRNIFKFGLRSKSKSSTTVSYRYRDFEYLKDRFFEIIESSPIKKQKAQELLRELRLNYRFEFEYKIMTDVLEYIIGEQSEESDVGFGATWSHQLENPPEFAVQSSDNFAELFTVRYDNGDVMWKINPSFFCYKRKAFKFHCSGWDGSVQMERMFAYYFLQLKDKYKRVLDVNDLYCEFICLDEYFFDPRLLHDVTYYFIENESTTFPLTIIETRGPQNEFLMRKFLQKITNAKNNFMVTYWIFLDSDTTQHVICCFAHVKVNGMKKDVEIMLVDNNGEECFSLDGVYECILRDAETIGFDNDAINFYLKEKMLFNINFGGKNIYQDFHCALSTYFISEIGWYIANTLPKTSVDNGFFNYFLKEVLKKIEAVNTEYLLSTYYISMMGTFFERLSNPETALVEHWNNKDVFVWNSISHNINYHLNKNLPHSLYFEAMKNGAITTFVGIQLPFIINAQNFLPDFFMERQGINNIHFFVPAIKTRTDTVDNILRFTSMLDPNIQLALDIRTNRYKYGDIDSVRSSDDLPNYMVHNWKYVFLTSKGTFEQRRRLAFENVFYINKLETLSQNQRLATELVSHINGEPAQGNRIDLITSFRNSHSNVLNMRLNILESMVKMYKKALQNIPGSKYVFAVIVLCILWNQFRRNGSREYITGFGFGNVSHIIQVTKGLRNIMIRPEDFPNLIALGNNADKIVRKVREVPIKVRTHVFDSFINSDEYRSLELSDEEKSSVENMITRVIYNESDI